PRPASAPPDAPGRPGPPLQERLQPRPHPPDCAPARARERSPATRNPSPFLPGGCLPHPSPPVDQAPTPRSRGVGAPATASPPLGRPAAHQPALPLVVRPEPSPAFVLRYMLFRPAC